jgi:hypothetical protein
MRHILETTVAVAAILITSDSAVGQPPPPATFEYAVKIVCGTSKGPSFAPGTYFTVVNVHSPTGVDFSTKVAVALDRHDPSTVSQFVGDGLKRDEAIAFDCTRIRRLTHYGSLPLLDGFLVIESHNYELDVVAVYSLATASGPAEAIHMERVPARRMSAR